MNERPADRLAIAVAQLNPIVGDVAGNLDPKEASYFGLCAATEDKSEGTTAFLEKRAPAFARASEMPPFYPWW